MITIHHSGDGTTVEGTERGDGAGPVLKAAGFRWGRSISAWYLPRAWGEVTRLAAAERAARELGDRAQLQLGDPAAAEPVATYRERRLAKAERLQGWAEKREATATAALKSHPEMRHDWAFITQPGRIVARERMNRSDERAFESLRKAEDMASRAAGIEAAAAGAIYSDDPDAIEQLEARIAGLEAERDRIKAYNTSCRKGQRDVKLLDEKQQRDLASCAKHASYQIRDNGAAPAYWSTNLSGNIRRQKLRLEELRKAAAGRVPATSEDGPREEV